MKKYHVLYIALAAITLGGCNSGGGLARAITDPFEPKPHGKATLAVSNDHINGILYARGTAADSIEIDGRSYANGSTIDIGHNFQNRLSDFGYVLKTGGRNLEDGRLGVYKRAYTAIVGAQVNNIYAPNGSKTAINEFHIRSIQGDVTPANQLPTSGIVRYQGHAFSGLDDRRPDGQPQGRLDYSINFGNRTGSGTITGLRGQGDITLNQGNLTPGNGIAGTVNSTRMGAGNYQLNIYGPGGAEIAGKATLDSQPSKEIGFGGSKVN